MFRDNDASVTSPVLRRFLGMTLATLGLSLTGCTLPEVGPAKTKQREADKVLVDLLAAEGVKRVTSDQDAFRDAKRVSLAPQMLEFGFPRVVRTELNLEYHMTRAISDALHGGSLPMNTAYGAEGYYSPAAFPPDKSQAFYEYSQGADGRLQREMRFGAITYLMFLDESDFTRGILDYSYRLKNPGPTGRIITSAEKIPNTELFSRHWYPPVRIAEQDQGKAGILFSVVADTSGMQAWNRGVESFLKTVPSKPDSAHTITLGRATP